MKVSGLWGAGGFSWLFTAGSELAKGKIPEKI
jgi:hypothetical protein